MKGLELQIFVTNFPAPCSDDHAPSLIKSDSTVSQMQLRVFLKDFDNPKFFALEIVPALLLA
jgi:hypothetical protein